MSATSTPDAGVPDAAHDAAYNPPDPNAYQGPRIFAGVDIREPHEIVVLDCKPHRYAAGFAILPGVTCSAIACGPGIECTRPQDCTMRPHARCLSNAEGHCEYGSGEVASSRCVSDDDCREEEGGECIGFITHTSCQYDNECTSSDDCENERRCECGSSGDLVCVEAN